VPLSRPAPPSAPSAELAVRPDSLPAAGRRLLATATDLRGVCGDVRVVAELAGRAFCAPLVMASAATGFVRAWDDAVGSEADVLDQLAGSLRGASWAYDDVESRLAGSAR
jgi:hypothetical protein